MKNIERSEDEKLMYVSVAEEYSFLHAMKMVDVLSMFKKNRIADVINNHYDVLHMLDISDSVAMVEKVLERARV